MKQETSNSLESFDIQVTARALIIKDGLLLLVSNDGILWYSAGGRLNPDESLPECVAREVKEELGIEGEVQDLVSVGEYIETSYNRHKVELYFRFKIFSLELPEQWSDLDGPVTHRKFFNAEQLQNRDLNIQPAFLRTLLDPDSDRSLPNYHAIDDCALFEKD